MKTWLLAILTAVVVAFAATAPTTARDLYVQGGSGGGPYRLECQPGAYVTGFNAATGAYVDRLSIVCSGWNADQKQFFVVSSNLATGRRNASGSNREGDSAYCPQGYAVFGIRPLFLRSDNHLLDALGATCASPEAPHVLYPRKIAILSEGETTFQDSGDVTSRDIESDIYNDLHAGSSPSTCNVGELVTGIYGKSGDAIDSIGLICQPAPKPSRSRYETPGALESNNSGVEVTHRPHHYPHGSMQNMPHVDNGQTTRRPEGDVQEPSVQIPGTPTPPRYTRQGMLYAFPYIRGSDGQLGLLDWCREWGGSCGELAATAFCQAITSDPNSRATNFQKFENVGRGRRTVIVSSRAVCSDPTCDTFSYVTCGR